MRARTLQLGRLIILSVVLTVISCSLLSPPDEYVPFPDLECTLYSTFVDPDLGYFLVMITITNPGDEPASDLQHHLYFHSAADNPVVYELSLDDSDLPESIAAYGTETATFVGYTVNGVPVRFSYYLYFTTPSLGGHRISALEEPM
ncbi:MAG: hypothetical protein KAU31_11220 [Spirochaetaceae bacterium]|nr:hypothetical protein [Spirochaetaceae bacterium]